MKCLCLTLATVIAAGPAAAQIPSPGDGFHVDSYTVSLKPDATTRFVTGAETVVVTGTAEGISRLAFSPNALEIRRATADGAPIKVVSTSDAVVFSLPRVLSKGQGLTLRFHIDGTPARGLIPTGGGLYTSYFACDWMVCLQDAPGDKADFSLDLIVPKGWTTVGVGRERPAQGLPSGLMRHRWRSTRPYSAYLYAFAAGPFPRQTIGPFTYVDATGMAADLARVFSQTPTIAAFLSDKSGLPLPDGHYTQVLAPGDEAQEAAGFSFIGASTLDQDRRTPAAAWIVAHEMAHQWWGNLVTCATWRDLWLDEGVTTFLVTAWQQQASGEAAYRQMLDVAKTRVDRARAAGFDKPLAWGGSYPSLRLRRAIQYSKGALFLDTLRDDLGDEAFWAGLRLFTQRHAGRTVTSHDFEAAMEAASGKDLSPMFKDWVYGPD